MRYWMVKFAPFRVSWENILANGMFEIYSVRSVQSRNNLEQMQVGDCAFYYHSQTERRVMGIMEVTKEAHQDFTTTDSRWKSVTFEPIESFSTPIPLSVIKANERLQGLTLVKQPRVAVSEVTALEFELIRKLGNGLVSCQDHNALSEIERKRNRHKKI